MYLRRWYNHVVPVPINTVDIWFISCSKQMALATWDTPKNLCYKSSCATNVMIWQMVTLVWRCFSSFRFWTNTELKRCVCLHRRSYSTSTSTQGQLALQLLTSFRNALYATRRKTCMCHWAAGILCKNPFYLLVNCAYQRASKQSSFIMRKDQIMSWWLPVLLVHHTAIGILFRSHGGWVWYYTSLRTRWPLSGLQDEPFGLNWQYVIKSACLLPCILLGWWAKLTWPFPLEGRYEWESFHKIKSDFYLWTPWTTQKTILYQSCRTANEIHWNESLFQFAHTFESLEDNDDDENSKIQSLQQDPNLQLTMEHFSWKYCFYVLPQEWLLDSYVTTCFVATRQYSRASHLPFRSILWIQAKCYWVSLAILCSSILSQIPNQPGFMGIPFFTLTCHLNFFARHMCSTVDTWNWCPWDFSRQWALLVWLFHHCGY